MKSYKYDIRLCTSKDVKDIFTHEERMKIFEMMKEEFKI